MSAARPEQMAQWRGLTSSDPLGLVIMLCDAAVEQLQRARGLRDWEDRAARTRLIANVQRILTELLCSLRPEADPQLAASLGALYEHLHARLTVTALADDEWSLAEMADVLEALSSAWRQAAHSLTAQDATPGGTRERGAAGPERLAEPRWDLGR